MNDFNQLTAKVGHYLKPFNRKRMKAAFDFAEKAHRGQIRKSGEPYITHPIATASLLADLHADEPTLIAALLHDVPEDTNYSLKDIEQYFDKDVAYLVSGITKLSKVYFRHHMEERQVESLKKLLLHSAKDVRVILIKLADRLHNMRTLDALQDHNKQLRIARETLEIYSPIANLFGLQLIKSEMEDLCFRFLFKMKYDSLKEQLAQHELKYGALLDKTIDSVKEALKGQKIPFQIEGRIKNMYSIFKKMEASGKSFPEIEDIIAVRVIVDSRETCYQVMGIIHSIFKPKMKRVKDYIAVPKNNGYQSLHTVVFGEQGIPTEFQIRTEQMHLEATYGLAAHYFYDQGYYQRPGKDFQTRSIKETNWAKKILMLQKEMKDNENFIDDLRFDVFQDRIFTFTPRGDVIDLPREATCIDFAYAIHTELGHSAKEAVVNNLKVPVSTVLNTGDTVLIINDPEQTRPKREWLNLVRTQLARNKIKEKLKKETRENRKGLGKLFLERELSKTKKNFYEVMNYKNIVFLLEQFQYRTFSDLLVAIGEGSLDPKVIIDKIYSRKNSSYEEILGTALKKDKNGRYRVDFKIIGKDRVGFMKTLLEPIANLGVNCLYTSAYTDLRSQKAVARLTLMIRNFEELSRICEVLAEIEDVESVERIVPRRHHFVTGLIIVGFLVWSIFPYSIHRILSLTASFNVLFWAVSLIGYLMIFLSICYIYQNIRPYFANWNDKKFIRVILPSLSLLASMVIFVEMSFFDVPMLLAIAYGVLNFGLCSLGLYFFGKKYGFVDNLLEEPAVPCATKEDIVRADESDEPSASPSSQVFQG